MSIVNTICEAIYAELIRIENNLHTEGRKEIKRVLVDYPTYIEIRKDRVFPHWCDICYPRSKDESMVITIMGIALVPTDEVEGFELMLDDGTLAPKAAKGTAQN